MTSPATTLASSTKLSYSDDGAALTFTAGGQQIASYTYNPTDAQYESPRPYFHPLTTLGGDEVTIFRPWDHVWHKGLSLALPNVGNDNFWCGATYTRATEYADLNNNGAMAHKAFSSISDGVAGITAAEELQWSSQDGDPVIAEKRRFNIQLLDVPGARAWALLFETEISNISPAPISIGSPTTEGRENAGYGGLFWRGPRSFTGGQFRSAAGTGTDEFMGSRSEWLAFTGRHDQSCHASTITFVEDSANLGAPNQWFARSSMFACLGSSPFFSEAVLLQAGDPLTYRYAVVISDGEVDQESAELLVGAAKAALGAWV
ncbi:PmoA family protein [Arthrobacter sp. BF1]|uniref:DUF6807 domain-containing protein n=1 Tax=Arthrobacter sp. BF1 TaxID=2821145 RepID=UPI001C4F220F|nr:PmoA family protein [Arthrobacter sp. BF1]